MEEPTGTPLGAELSATLLESGRQFAATLAFKWTPQPLQHPYPAWQLNQPGTDFIPLFQPWEFALHCRLTGEISLLAANPEPPGPVQSPPFLLLAFGRVNADRTASKADSPEQQQHRFLSRLWTFEVPLADGTKWLRQRSNTKHDGEKLLALIKDSSATAVSCAAWPFSGKAPQNAPSITATTGIDPFSAANSGEPESVQPEMSGKLESTLRIPYPCGFEPAGCREFLAIANELAHGDLRHRLEMQGTWEDDGSLLLQLNGSAPATPLRWEKWHGSTLGSKDEPTGVETPIFGTDDWSASAKLSAGVPALVSARSIGDRLRLTFSDWIQTDEAPAPHAIDAKAHVTQSQSLLVLETPVHPWLVRLQKATTADADANAALISELSQARVIAATFQALGNTGRQKSSSGTGFLNQSNYLNRSLRGDHWFFNPRHAHPATAGWDVETEAEATAEERDHLTLHAREMVGQQRYALWLPGSPLHTQKNSGIQRPILQSSELETTVADADGREHLLSASLLPSGPFRREAALRWVLVRRTGAPPAENRASVAAEDRVEFTILAAAGPAMEMQEPMQANPPGEILGYQSTTIGTRSRSGLDWDSLITSDQNTEKGVIPDQAEIFTTPCGLSVSSTKDTWTLSFQPLPTIIQEELQAPDESPPPAKQVNVKVRCERAQYVPAAKAQGSLPQLGKQSRISLGDGRTLVVRHFR